MTLFAILSVLIVLSQTLITSSTYTVAILNNGKLIGNGALIDKEYIVTSASCVGGTKTSKLIIRAGSENYNRGGVQAEVAKIIAHKKYNESTHDYDIAVLKLKGCLEIATSHVDVIPISTQKHSSAEEGVLTGWTYNDVAEPSQLKSVTVHRRSKCDRVPHVTISKRMFCAGTTKTEGCMDFLPGSPLVVEGKLIGIKCAGVPCDQGQPDVFTNIQAKLYKFVQKVVKRFA